MLLPIILLIYLIATNKSTIQKIFSSEVLHKLSAGGKYMSAQTRNVLLFIALILMTISLARPVINEQEHESKQELIPIVVAIDVSKSMLANDVYPNRLELAKKKLKYIITSAKNSAIGVVLFAKSSFMLSPITQDFTSLLYMVEHLDTGLNFDNGSNILSLLQTTQKLTKDFSVKNLVILSDGANKDNYEKELEYAKQNSINIYVVAIATQKGSAIPKKDGGYMTNSAGEIVVVKKNEAIKDLAISSAGGYIDFTLGNNDIDAILNDLYSKSKKQRFQNQKIKTYTELFYYPLALAILILLIAFSSLPKRRVVTNSFIFILVAFFPTSNYGFSFDFTHINKANQAYKKGDFKTASKEFSNVTQTAQGSYNFANSLYKQKEYEKALKQYEHVITNDKELEYRKLHNMGNCFVKLNELQKAKEFYEKALKIKKDKQIKQNLDKVNELLKKQKQKKEKKKKQNKQNNQNQKDKKNQQKNSKDNKNKQDKKNSSNNQDQKDKQNQSKNKKQQDKKSDKNQNKQDLNRSKQQQKMQKFDPKSISDTEEKKWMKIISEQKTSVMLHKVKTKQSENNDDIKNPW
jgi:Ca-activated chloride channel family protein